MHGFQAFYKSLTERFNLHLLHEHEPAHPNCSCIAPLFNVVENDKDYILDGEFPGTGDQNSIRVVWLQNQVVAIDGFVGPPQAHDESTPIEETPPSEQMLTQGENLY